MERQISVGVIGDFDPGFPPHLATNAALGHSAAAVGADVDVRWHATDSLAGGDLAELSIEDALLCAPGSPYRSLDGALRAIRFAREGDVPLLGTCGGFQHVAIEYARNVLGFEDAQHAEYDPYASRLFIAELSCSLAGKTMAVELAAGSRAAQLYGRTQVRERYYCNFGLDSEHQELLDEGGLRVVGVDQDGEARVLELPDRRLIPRVPAPPDHRLSAGGDARRLMRVLIPLPDRDFDTTEVAVPWRLLSDRGHEVVFATQGGGSAPQCDPKLLEGILFGRLGAEPEPVSFYRRLSEEPAFREPLAWGSIEPADFDGLVLPGGHARGMRQYLGDAELQAKVAEFWALERPVGAICHGVIVLARSLDPASGRSVLAGRRTTCLPKYMERSAFLLTAWKLGRYYRTYPAYVEDEVVAALADPADFERGPRTTTRGTDADDSAAFVVEDGNYLSARWPGDAYLFAKRFERMLSAAGASS
jgi:putative intracellular protease/amidase